MPKADIIVCTRNNEDIIDACLKSIGKQTVRNFSCILVDDCSTDRTIETVRKKYPWVRIIKKENPTGPAISRNMAIKASHSEFIATIDSDAQLDTNWLKEQLELMKDEGIGIGASKIFYSWNKRKINSCGGTMTKFGFGFNRASDEGKPVPVLYGHSAAMMVRRKMLKETGPFDETYFYGNEDTDLGWRANLAGWKVVFNPRAVAYHDENRTVRQMPWSVDFHGTKNRLRSMLKNYSVRNIAKYLPVHILLVIGKTAISGNRSARLDALVWNCMHIVSTLKERRHVQKTRKLDDKDLMTYIFANSRRNSSSFVPKSPIL